MKNLFYVTIVVAFLVALVGCSPRQMVIGQLADSLAIQGQSEEEDLELAREASAFYLKLSESVLQERPGHVALAESVAAGFTQYAYAFVACQADYIEEHDLREALHLRKRAAKLYKRAHLHAITALEKSHPSFLEALRGEEGQWPSISRDEVGLAYWAVASWGGWISLSLGEPDLVADLPLAARLAHLAWQVDSDWGQGSLTNLLATFESSLPAGNPDQALAWFDQAIDQAGGLSAGPLVGKAENYALPLGDRENFELLLKEALAIEEKNAGQFALQNQVMQRRAAWLLLKADDLF
jgi:hypothetical protein